MPRANVWARAKLRCRFSAHASDTQWVSSTVQTTTHLWKMNYLPFQKPTGKLCVMECDICWYQLALSSADFDILAVKSWQACIMYAAYMYCVCKQVRQRRSHYSVQCRHTVEKDKQTLYMPSMTQWGKKLQFRSWPVGAGSKSDSFPISSHFMMAKFFQFLSPTTSNQSPVQRLPQLYWPHDQKCQSMLSYVALT